MIRKHSPVLWFVFAAAVMVLITGKIQLAYGDSLAPLITHTKVSDTQEGSTVTITAVIIDNDDVASASVFYKAADMTSFTPIPMRRLGNIYDVVIPAEDVKSPGFSYYIEATDKSGNVAYNPEGRADAPYKVAVASVAKAVKPAENVTPQKRKPSGNALFTFQNANVSYPLGANPGTALDFVALQPGQIYTYNLNMAGMENNQPYTFWLNREQELYTGRDFDRLRYTTNLGSVQVNAGDFYATFSKLALDSVEVRGLSIKSTAPHNNFQLIFGRTFRATSESKKLSPVFLQMFTAARKEFEGKKSLLGVNFLINNDDLGSIPATAKIVPTDNTVASIDYKYLLSKRYFLLTEFANGSGTKDDPTTAAIEAVPFSDSAYRLSVNYLTEKTQATLLYNRVGPDYLRGGTLQSTMGNANNKKGFLLTVDSQPWEQLGFNVKWEKYRDNLNGRLSTGTTTTNDKSLGLSYMPNQFLTLNGRLSNLDRTGGTSPSASKARGLGLTYRTPGFWLFGGTTLLGNFQRITYDSAPVNLKINLLLFSLDSAYKDVFSFSASYNTTKTDEATTTASNKQSKKDIKLGITWNVIPFKFTAQTNYNYIRNFKTDNSINNHERDYGLVLNYYLTRAKIFSVGGKTIQYRDFGATTVNSYNEQIFLTRYSESF